MFPPLQFAQHERRSRAEDELESWRSPGTSADNSGHVITPQVKVSFPKADLPAMENWRENGGAEGIGGDKPATLSGADAAVLTRKDELELIEKRRQNQISAISIAVTFVIAIVSLLWNARIQRQTAQTSNVLEMTRVENGEVISNSNGSDFKNPWRQWEESVSDTTVYLGIERFVNFDRHFENPPDVTLGLSLIDLSPMDVVLSRVNFKPQDPLMAERIHHVHVVTQVAGVNRDHFIVQIGVGLPTEAARALAPPLTRELDARDRDFIEHMRRFRQLENRSDRLNPGEIWLINFYRIVGSFKVTWIAQAAEDSSVPKKATAP
jgi:hypothetical protein